MSFSNSLTLYLICEFQALSIQQQIKIWCKKMDKWGYKYLIEWKALWEKEKLLITSNFFFSLDVYKSCLLLMRQNEYLWSKGLRTENMFYFLNFRVFRFIVTCKVEITYMYDSQFNMTEACDYRKTLHVFVYDIVYLTIFYACISIL